MGNCSGAESKVDSEKSYNHVLTYKGKPIPGVSVNQAQKQITYIRNGRTVTTSFSGAITYKVSSIAKTAPSNKQVQVGSYIRTVDSAGWTTSVKPIISTDSKGRLTIPDGVDRSDIQSGHDYYSQKVDSDGNVQFRNDPSPIPAQYKK